ncbi:hypothetical protein KSF_109460 [Reticulibacter mediterranei]|uniref:Uncharacterized protein n=1 Tax=Reticulibacter mediterranei TaxID=2778369 RepID=A0A8J3N9K7_9CHLR|nr:UbiA family prenyltransferase [Reticulibacter mediterranei]GHP00899.1 hypothetical protein KSF_109460 [Reticulibacter mediterranei]
MGKQARAWISLLFTWAIPRPVDVLAKAWFFLYGLAATLVFGQPSENQTMLGNGLFHPSPAWQGNEIPIWAIVTCLFIYFILEELLVQQAKLIWDDIRDRDRDQKLLHNRERAIAKGIISVRQARWNMLARLVLAALFIVWQRRVDLLVVFSVIFLHQAVYLWAKPRGATHPLGLLFWLSFNNSLRFFAGTVAIGGFQAFLPLILMFVTCYFCSVGGLAAQWKMEAQDVGQNIRPQSAYFAVRGEFWQQVGLLDAILVAGLLVLYCLFSLCEVQGALLYLTDSLHCSTTPPNRGLLGGIVSLLLIGVFLFVDMTLIRHLQNTGISTFLARRIKQSKQQALLLCGGIICVSGGIILSSLFLAWMQPYAPFLLAVILLSMTMLYKILYEGMSYQAFAHIGGRQ